MKIQINKNTTPIVSPAVVISMGKWEETNLITLAWVARVVSSPPIMSISIRPSRHSHQLIETLGEYVINVPSKEQVEVVDFCGTRSGKKIDKWKELQLTKQKALKIQVPLIKEFPINIECKVIKKIMLGTHHIYLGEVMAVHVDEEFIDETELDSTRLSQIVYFDRKYHSTNTNILQRQGFSLK
ncbi:MAG: Flavoredoxin [Promethearchaeota archaeon]|nr:MAG: Flavoredoxin [Candidatus Lokiarchaeota archaeon]